MKKLIFLILLLVSLLFIACEDTTSGFITPVPIDVNIKLKMPNYLSSTGNMVIPSEACASIEASKYRLTCPHKFTVTAQDMRYFNRIEAYLVKEGVTPGEDKRYRCHIVERTDYEEPAINWQSCISSGDMVNIAYDCCDFTARSKDFYIQFAPSQSGEGPEAGEFSRFLDENPEIYPSYENAVTLNPLYTNSMFTEEENVYILDEIDMGSEKTGSDDFGIHNFDISDVCSVGTTEGTFEPASFKYRLNDISVTANKNITLKIFNLSHTEIASHSITLVPGTSNYGPWSVNDESGWFEYTIENSTDEGFSYTVVCTTSYNCSIDTSQHTQRAQPLSGFVPDAFCPTIVSPSGEFVINDLNIGTRQAKYVDPNKECRIRISYSVKTDGTSLSRDQIQDIFCALPSPISDETPVVNGILMIDVNDITEGKEEIPMTCYYTANPNELYMCSDWIDVTGQSFINCPKSFEFDFFASPYCDENLKAENFKIRMQYYKTSAYHFEIVLNNNSNEYPSDITYNMQITERNEGGDVNYTTATRSCEELANSLLFKDKSFTLSSNYVPRIKYPSNARADIVYDPSIAKTLYYNFSANPGSWDNQTLIFSPSDYLNEFFRRDAEIDFDSPTTLTELSMAGTSSDTWFNDQIAIANSGADFPLAISDYTTYDPETDFDGAEDQITWKIQRNYYSDVLDNRYPSENMFECTSYFGRTFCSMEGSSYNDYNREKIFSTSELELNWKNTFLCTGDYSDSPLDGGEEEDNYSPGALTHVTPVSVRLKSGTDFDFEVYYGDFFTRCTSNPSETDVKYLITYLMGQSSVDFYPPFTSPWQDNYFDDFETEDESVIIDRLFSIFKKESNRLAYFDNSTHSLDLAEEYFSNRGIISETYDITSVDDDLYKTYLYGLPIRDIVVAPTGFGIGSISPKFESWEYLTEFDGVEATELTEHSELLNVPWIALISDWTKQVELSLMYFEKTYNAVENEDNLESSWNIRNYSSIPFNSTSTTHVPSEMSIIDYMTYMYNTTPSLSGHEWKNAYVGMYRMGRRFPFPIYAVYGIDFNDNTTVPVVGHLFPDDILGSDESAEFTWGSWKYAMQEDAINDEAFILDDHIKERLAQRAEYLKDVREIDITEDE